MIARLLLICGIVTASGCSSAPSRFDLPAFPAGSPIRMEAIPPFPVVAQEQRARYYVDEHGNVWDDRGKQRAPPI